MSEPRPPPPKRLYFDNAATSFPKPPEVAQAMLRCMNEVGASPGRGAYAEAIEAGRILMRCRELINRLIHGESPSHIVFTLNASDALNLAIKGLVQHHHRRGDKVHIVTTRMDHNSILRPLRSLAIDDLRLTIDDSHATPSPPPPLNRQSSINNRQSVEVTRLEVDPQTGRVDPNDVAAALRSDTRLVAMIHGSNVTGALQPVTEIGAMCRARNVPFLVDAAQTIGHIPIDVQAMNIDLLAFPGHKGLLGPLGTGGLYLRPGMERLIDTVREGGTGTDSERDVQPDHMPDKYEPGSHNAPGIAGLAAGVQWILDRGVDELWAHERQLMRIMLDGLRPPNVPGLRVLGEQTVENRCGVISIVIDGMDPADLAAILEEHYGILARAGLHCAPLAHQTLGTSAGGGAVRLSPGPFLTEDDVRYAVESIIDIAREQSMAGVPQVAAAPLQQARAPSS